VLFKYCQMFFRIAHDRDQRFPHHHQLTDQLWLSTDSGWQRHGDCVIKGYADEVPLADIPTHPDRRQLRGNFCVFETQGNSVEIVHGSERTFPMWRSAAAVTNLYAEGDQVWADKRLLINADMSCEVTRDITWNTAAAQDDSGLLDSIHHLLLHKFKAFLAHNKLPIKLFLTGGIDTTTVWAYLDHVGADYEVVDYEYVKHTPFYVKNQKRVKEFTFYNQTQLWDEDCVLASGACGDEMLLRGPKTLSMALARHKVELEGLTQENDYHYEYYARYRHDSHKPRDYSKVILDTLYNDHQHWHIDRTLHFTPLKDMRLPALVLQASKELLVAQARNAEINRALISRMDASKLKKITKYKNS
jgi:hypothetical protein